jgi:hypothetical protein
VVTSTVQLPPRRQQKKVLFIAPLINTRLVLLKHTTVNTMMAIYKDNHLKKVLQEWHTLAP